MCIRDRCVCVCACVQVLDYITHAEEDVVNEERQQVRNKVFLVTFQTYGNICDAYRLSLSCGMLGY